MSESRQADAHVGFFWLKLTRLEAQVYSIRRIQPHAGKLAAFLRRVQGQGTSWVGSHGTDAENPEDRIHESPRFYLTPG